ncbi:hypothetical protein QTP88_028181 [Uroleucon formosanum]
MTLGERLSVLYNQHHAQCVTINTFFQPNNEALSQLSKEAADRLDVKVKSGGLRPAHEEEATNTSIPGWLASAGPRRGHLL